MNNLHLSSDARRDLAEIKTYIAEDLENPKAALSTVAGITKSIRMLRSHALIGTPLTAVTNTDREYRYLVSGNYMVFYRVTDSDVFIDRILYARRDYLHILFDDDLSS